MNTVGVPHWVTEISSFMTVIMILPYLFFVAVGIYCTVLFIKFTRRGIKAFDLYIKEKADREP